MEEKKLNPNQGKKEEQKLSYDELNKLVGELYQQNQNLLYQIKQANLANAFKRLDSLFKVLKYHEVFEDREFVAKCALEIKDALYSTAQKEEGKEE